MSFGNINRFCFMCSYVHQLFIKQRNKILNTTLFFAGQLEPVIIDFGLSLFRTSKLDDLPFDVTSESGDPSRFAHLPVEARCHGRVGPRSDLYTLGYELTTVAKVLDSTKLKDLSNELMNDDDYLRIDHDAVAKKVKKLYKKAHKREHPSFFKRLFSCFRR